MRWMTLLGLLAVMAMPANLFAQDAEKPKEDPKSAEEKKAEEAKQNAERRVEWALRSMGNLNLSDAQKEQVKKILVDTELKSGKLRDASKVEIEKLLTPEQKEQYKALAERGRGGRGGQGRGGRGGRGGMGNMLGRFGMDPAQLREQLGLTPEQEKKIQEITTGIGAKAMEKFAEMRQGGGGWDMSKMRGIIGEIRKDANKQIEAILTDEQKPKFAELNKKIDEQMEQWGMGRGGRGGRGGGERTRAPREAATPEAMTARRLDDAMKDLALGQEEAAVIQPLVKKVIEYQETVRKSQKDARTALGKMSEEDAIKAKIEEIRTSREEFETKLKLMQEGLRELLTLQQEGKMIARGVLR